MGITGLIPFLDKATRKITVKELRGNVVGLDSYCFLHKGAIACADKLIRGDPTDLHIQYCLKYVNLLRSHNVVPILVFDGRHLPAKALTEKRRRKDRQKAKEKAKELLREGKTNEARSFINRGVDITHDMAHELITVCRRINVDCIVAPYEADGQLAYLSKIKKIDYVITEDSDLTLFGCQKIIFKFDLSGQGLLFDAKDLYKAMGCKPEKYTFRKFQIMCILSGCDYLDSLKGVGLVKACKFVLMTEETDVKKCLTKLPSYLNLKGVTVDEEYKENFLRALATFNYMYVYDPIQRKQCRLNELEIEDCMYVQNAGEEIDPELAFQMAVGNVNPFTLKQFDHWCPPELCTYNSIWSNNIQQKESPVVSNRHLITINRTTPTKKRTILRAITNEEEDEKNTSMDILNMYLEPLKSQQYTPPEAKKFKSSLFDSGNRTEGKNPFLKRQSTKDDEMADNKIQTQSLLQQANSIKSENTSRFKKTVIEDPKINFVSRFFSGMTKEQDKNPTIETDEGMDSEIGTTACNEVVTKKTNEEESMEHTEEEENQSQSRADDGKAVEETKVTDDLNSDITPPSTDKHPEIPTEERVEPNPATTDVDNGPNDKLANRGKEIQDEGLPDSEEYETSALDFLELSYSGRTTPIDQMITNTRDSPTANKENADDTAIILSDDESPKKRNTPIKKKPVDMLGFWERPTAGKKKIFQPSINAFFQKKTIKQ